MEALWHAAIGLTGIAGVGSFVLFALYKEWMHLGAVSTLSRPQRFSLFKLFLIVTFSFAIATLALGAYRSYLNKQATQASANELRRLLNDRQQEGRRLIASFRKSTTPELARELEAFSQTYEAQISASNGALENGELVRYHELSKQLIILVEESGLSSEQKMHFLQGACPASFSRRF